ncbi:hypothetical protein PRIPAC_82839 [Pristionchus pacificus]|uniref:Uncharacterized protein n=1 Tax=Pristionchus pacificus TaxID=54126 RepID=A0A2A6CP97_PRIPA|nr:hypothetical protein PRIPAC_82839 [Pristionchus pacificus]|eukprot:PDM79926.1 hypothetical protein PRIPAC_32505 [Pristionchus pacificus]
MWTAFVLFFVIASAHAFPASTPNPCDGVLGCNNHGTCAGTLEEGQYCICDPGYFGLRCQLPDEEPACETMIDCNGNGKCAGGVEDLHCECFDGWYGHLAGMSQHSSLIMRLSMFFLLLCLVACAVAKHSRKSHKVKSESSESDEKSSPRSGSNSDSHEHSRTKRHHRHTKRPHHHHHSSPAPSPSHPHHHHHHSSPAPLPSTDVHEVPEASTFAPERPTEFPDVVTGQSTTDEISTESPEVTDATEASQAPEEASTGGFSKTGFPVELFDTTDDRLDAIELTNF